MYKFREQLWVNHTITICSNFYSQHPAQKETRKNSPQRENSVFQAFLDILANHFYSVLKKIFHCKKTNVTDMLKNTTAKVDLILILFSDATFLKIKTNKIISFWKSQINEWKKKRVTSEGWWLTQSSKKITKNSMQNRRHCHLKEWYCTPTIQRNTSNKIHLS